MLALLVRRFRRSLLIAALSSAVSGACSVLMLSQIALALGRSAADAQLIAWRFGTAALAVMLAGLFSTVLFERLRQRANAEIRRHICDQVMLAPYRALEQLGAPRIQSALSEHAGGVAQFFVSLPVLLTNGVIVLGGMIYLVVLSPTVFLLTATVVGVGSVGYHYAHLRAIRFLRAGSAEQDRLFEHFRSLTDGAKELRLNRSKRAVFLQQILHRSIERVRHQRVVGMMIFGAASSWGNFLIYAFLGIVLFGLAPELPNRTQVIAGFALLVVYLVGPLQSLLLALPNANLARVASERIETLLRELTSAESANPTAQGLRFQSLALEGVRHRYPGEASDEIFEVGPIDLAVRPGEVTFLVGGNGSGKTTLAKLLVGLYAPEHGRICVNGASVDDSNRDEYRQLFSAIFSDFHLFAELLERRSAEFDERGNRLLARLHLQHKVKLQDGAFTTRNLSHGQRKRLALVVTYLENRPLVVFDEWAADQDPAFKEVFYHEVLHELRCAGKAVIVISHDERYFHVADRVIHMDSGRIVSIVAQPVARAGNSLR